jgi:hypothetical protein
MIAVIDCISFLYSDLKKTDIFSRFKAEKTAHVNLLSHKTHPNEI